MVLKTCSVKWSVTDARHCVQLHPNLRTPEWDLSGMGNDSTMNGIVYQPPWTFRPSCQARSQDRFWGLRDPQKVNLLDTKSGLFEPNPLNPPTKTPFLAHFVAKSGPLGRFGGCVAPPAPPPPATGLHLAMLGGYQLINFWYQKKSTSLL